MQNTVLRLPGKAPFRVHVQCYARLECSQGMFMTVYGTKSIFGDRHLRISSSTVLKSTSYHVEFLANRPAATVMLPLVQERADADNEQG